MIGAMLTVQIGLLAVLIGVRFVISAMTSRNENSADALPSVRNCNIILNCQFKIICISITNDL